MGVQIKDLTAKSTPVEADLFEIQDGATDDGAKVTLAQLRTVLLNLPTGVNIVLATSGSGTKIGTSASQLLAFFNATPIVQPSGANQAALTNSSGGTYNGTIEAVGATNTGDVSGAINNNFTELYTLLSEIRLALVNLGLIKGSA